MSRIVIWNMQGGQGTKESKWNSIAGLIGTPKKHDLGSNPPDVFLIQECSEVPGLVRPQTWGNNPNPPDDVTWGSKKYSVTSHDHYYFVAHHHFGTGNDRVSFAVMIRTNAVPDGTDLVAQDLRTKVVVHSPTETSGRAIIGVTRSNVTYFSMHAPSIKNAPRSMLYINDLASQIGVKTRYVIGGDFNCEPDQDFKDCVPGTIVNVGQPTHQNGRELDYFMWGHTNAPLVTKPVRLGILQSDHYPVAATLTA